MKIVVDADACPVKNEIVKVAQELKIHVVMFIDTSHQYKHEYCEVRVIDKAADAVDFALINVVKPNDIVVTQDYGVATMSLAKGAAAMDFNGMIFNSENIDELLFKRYLSAKIRRSGGKTKGPKKRDRDTNQKFYDTLKHLCINLHNSN